MLYAKCHNCGGEMKNTGSTSYGTGTPIYKCTSCGFTSIHNKRGLLKKCTSEKDIFYDITNGSIKYADCKCVMKTVDKNGGDVSELTTRRADIIVRVLRETAMLQTFEPGSTFTMKITFEEKK